MRSDNISGVSEEILKAIIAENNGEAMAYGGDDATAFSEKILKNIFENDDLKSFNMVSGTATNSLILATLSPTFGAIFCHKNSHVYGDECGANEFQSGGAKLVTLDGENGKLIPSVLDDAISAHIIGEPHHSQPAVITLAQSTEAGTVYSLSEIKAISEIAKKHKLKLHMDGARFANA
ncbi:MAG: beta-eliminating lyase-related protein, partial [Emcibacteraceae bacterium]|nr:beta-eliminating lyase-related protein [Emcibacteraceae bacterium]